MKRCSKKECCKQCRYVKFKGTMTKWPVQKPTHRTTQKHVQHHDGLSWSWTFCSFDNDTCHCTSLLYCKYSRRSYFRDFCSIARFLIYSDTSFKSNKAVWRTKTWYMRELMISQIIVNGIWLKFKHHYFWFYIEVSLMLCSACPSQCWKYTLLFIK